MLVLNFDPDFEVGWIMVFSKLASVSFDCLSERVLLILQADQS